MIMMFKHALFVGVLIGLYCPTSAAHNGEEEKTSASHFSSIVLDVHNTCPTDHQRNFALDHISRGIHSELSGLLRKVIKCDSNNLGKYPHCAVGNCSVLFDRAVKEGFIRFSGLYWLQPPNENATKVFCNHETRHPEVSSCRLLFHYHPTAKSGHYTLLLRDGVRSVVYCNRETGRPEPESCAHAHQLELPTGDYILRPPPDNEPLNNTVHCDMNREECGNGTWWMKLASKDFSNSSTPCPANWQLLSSPIRACTRTTADGCDSYLIPSGGQNYSRVCGRITAYQRGPAFGFWLSGHNNLSQSYLNGVSVTHGNTPRQHIWSFAASLGNSYCPCSDSGAGSPLPSFVANHYFCETDEQGGTSQGTFILNNPLWDGMTCFGEDACCQFNNPPWFSRTLPTATTDDIEIRLCGLTSVSNYSTPITGLDLYVR